VTGRMQTGVFGDELLGDDGQRAEVGVERRTG
jgi:hypothetical protein